MARQAVYSLGVLVRRDADAWLLTTAVIASSDEEASEKGIAWAERDYPPSEGYYVWLIATSNLFELKLMDELTTREMTKRFQPESDEDAPEVLM